MSEDIFNTSIYTDISIGDYSIHRDVLIGSYVATLLGGEFSNCHGYGNTEDEALIGLKIRVYQLRRKNNLN